MMQNAQKGMAKWTVRILLGLLIISFGMWGIADYATGPVNPPVAYAGDREIRTDTFLNEAQRRIQALGRQQNRVIDTRTAINQGLYAQTLSALIDRNTLLSKADQWNLGVADAVVVAEIQNDPAFQTATGNFDRLRFDSIMRNAGFTEQGFITSLREDIVNRQIESTVTGGLNRGHDVLARAIMAYQLETRVLRMLEVPNDKLANASAPDEATLVAYHKANATQFSTPERRSARIVYLTPDDLTADIIIDERPILEAYENQIDSFTTAGRREIKQAIFTDEASAQAAMDQITSGGSFDAVVQEATNGPPIDLGEVREGDLVGAVGEAAFNAEANSVVGPPQSNFGWHLIQVGAVTEGSVQPLEEVREQLVRDLKLEAALEELIEKGNLIEDELAGGGRAADVAAALNVQAMELPAMSRTGETASGETPASELPSAALRDLFSQTQDADLEAIEMGDGSWLLVELLEIQAPELRPLEDVRDDVLAAVKTQALGDLAAAERDKLLDRLKSGAAISAIAAELGVAIQTTDPITRHSGAPSLSGPARDAAFNLESGQATGGASADGQTQFLIQLVEIIPADIAEDDEGANNLASTIGEAFAEDVRALYLSTLRDEIGFTDNEATFREAVDPNGIYFN